MSKIIINDKGVVTVRRRQTTEGIIGVTSIDIDLPIGNIDLQSKHIRTQGITDIWVNGTTGSDTNDGTQSSPFETIGAAIDRAKLLSTHAVTIRIKSGSYVENIYLPNLIATSASFIIQGEDWSAPSVSGILSGTFTASSGTYHSVTDGGWAENELRGHFVRLYAGSLSGSYLPIASNLSSSLEVPGLTSLSGVTFDIVKPDVLIMPESTASYAVTMTGQGQSAESLGIFGVEIRGGTRGVRLANLSDITSCKIVDQTAFGINSLYSRGATISNSYVACITGSNGAVPISFDQCGIVTLLRSVVRGPGQTGTSRALSARSTYYANISGCILENATSCGIFTGGRYFISSTRVHQMQVHGLLLFNCTAVITSCTFQGSGGLSSAGITISPSSNTEISDACSCNVRSSTFSQLAIGIASYTRSDIILRSSTTIANCTLYGIMLYHPHSSLVTEATCKIETCGIGIFIQQPAAASQLNLYGPIVNSTNSGIDVYSTHNGIILNAGMILTGSGQFGIDIGLSQCGFNQITVASTTVMTGNVGGDFRLRQATSQTLSLTTLRATTGKSVIVSGSFNRIMEQ